MQAFDSHWCETCGEKFIPASPDQNVCSKKCREELDDVLARIDDWFESGQWRDSVMSECCSWSEPCEGHKARISPELQAKLDAVETEEEKGQVAAEYIIDAFMHGEWNFKL